MARIVELPPDLVDKIAAGEVVERPASVVKELVENAIDAGARRIDLAVEGGGTRLVRVTDDGEGIVAEDLPLAVRSHATSKVRTADDLFAIRTLGFRGEALASVASVSRLRLASRAAGAAAGAELRVDGGRAGEVRPAGLPRGTTVEVADLFFNVPARRAFLRSEPAELRAVLAEVRRMALARGDVHVTLSCDGRAVLDAPAEDEPRARLAQVLGRELADELLPVVATRNAAGEVRGYASPCDRSRGDTQQQFFFLNGRVVRGVTLLAAVRHAYANLLPGRRHPSLVLWLDVPPDEVDVNVHPQKTEVRFRRERDLFHLVARGLEATLQGAGLVAGPGGLRGGLPQRAEPGGPLARRASEGLGVAGEGVDLAQRDPTLANEPPDRATDRATDRVGRFLHVHRRYVVEETDAGVRVVDPHALHERILYEEIRERLLEQPLESQRFLFPQVLDVGAVERDGLGARGELLARLGFEVEPFGQNAVAVHAAPRLLAAERVPDAVRDLLLAEPEERAAEEDDGGRERGLLHDLAAALACKAAVRFGEALPDAQLEALLARRGAVRRGHCCPHGRPTALALTLDELDRRFGRQGTRGGPAGAREE